MTYDPIDPRELCEKNIQDSTKKGLGGNNYTHDPYCPQAQMYQDNAIFWWDECQDDFDCRCELISKVRDDEREEAWIVGYNTGFKYGLKEANITMEEYQERSRNMYKLGKALEELANSNEDT